MAVMVCLGHRRTPQAGGADWAFNQIAVGSTVRAATSSVDPPSKPSASGCGSTPAPVRTCAWPTGTAGST